MRNLPPPFNVLVQALSDWWESLFTLAVAGLIWTLCWLTVVLGPPATAGLYYLTYHMARGQNLGVGGMVEGARLYLLKSWLWGLLNLAALFVMSVSFLFYGQVTAMWGAVLQGFVMVIALIWLGTQLYALPYLMEQDDKRLVLALRNGLYTALASPLYTLILVILSLIFLVLSALVVFPLIAGGPGFLAAIGTRAVLERIETFGIREEKAGSGDDE
jgi:hypothetical protein